MLKSVFLLTLCFQFSVQKKTALLIIDVQNCFLPGGSLAVNDGDQIIPIINSIRDLFDVVVLTQDWHCLNHISFASQHPDSQIFDEISLNYDSNGKLCSDCSDFVVNQTLWPDHCVMDTSGAQLSPVLQVEPSDLVIKKGDDCQVRKVFFLFARSVDFQFVDFRLILIQLFMTMVVSVKQT